MTLEKAKGILKRLALHYENEEYDAIKTAISVLDFISDKNVEDDCEDDS